MKNRMKCMFRGFSLFIVFIMLKSNVAFAVQAPINNGGVSTANGSALNLSIGYIDGYLKAFGGVVIFIAVALTGVRMVLMHNKPEDRADSMTAILHIALGAFIIGAAFLIAGFLLGTENNMLGSFSKSAESVDKEKTSEVADDSNFMSRALSVPLNAVIDTILGDGDKDGIQKLMGFKAIDKLIFNDGSVVGTEPFSAKEWSSLDYLYVMFIGITTPFILIMVAKTGFLAIKNSNSVSKRIGLKDDIGRWFFSIFIVAASPLFFRGLVYFFNLMSSAIYQNIIVPTSVSDSSLSIDATSIQKIKTGNVFSTAIVKVIFCYLDVKINIVFLARKIMLSVMYVFTPIAACLWGINRNVNAASMWFGEIITNSAMAFFYGITYTVMCVMINATGSTGWFFTMMWMFSMMKISEVLRNSLQGLFARLSGVNEEDMGKGAAGIVGGALMTARKTTKSAAGSAREMAMNAFTGSSATANSNGNTNYSMMGGKSIKAHNSKSADSIGNSPKQNRGNTSAAGAYNSEGKDSHRESNMETSSNNKMELSNTNFAGETMVSTQNAKGRNVGGHNENKMTGDKSTSQGSIKTPVKRFSTKNAAYSQYSDMLCNNYDKELLKNGQKSSAMGTGGNKILNRIEGANRIKNAQVRKNAAASAITTTVDRMVHDSKNRNSNLYKINNRPINEKEATKILFGNDSTDKNRKSFIRNARINNINGAKQIIASTNPYISADTSFRWNQEH